MNADGLRMANDERDFQFAKKYNLPIRPVIQPKDGSLPDELDEAYTEDGILIHSEDFNGMDNREAITAITKHLKEIGAYLKIFLGR